MARSKSGVNKSEKIREYKKAHPNAKPKAIAAALAEEGIIVTPQHVSTTLYHAKKQKGRTKRGRLVSVGRKPDRNGSDFSFLLQAKKFLDEAGSLDKARAALDVLAKLQ